MTLTRLSGRHRTTVVRMILAASICAVGLLGSFPTLSLADEPLKVQLSVANFKSWPFGTMTHVTEQAIEIDRTSYRFKEGAVVRGDDGGSVDLKTLTGTPRVYYHLKDQQVDGLVVELMR